jgi:hypothetical protein
MMFTKLYAAICFLAVALIALAACSAQEKETVAETAVPAEIPDDVWQDAIQGCR